MKDCEICGGYGKIRLLVREKLNTSATINFASTLMSKIREYPCPECGDQIPQENIKIIQAEDYVSGDIREAGYVIHCKREIAYKMGQFLFDDDQITFTKDTKIPEYSWRNDYILRGKLGIVSPRFVAKLEERVKECQELMAKEVVEEARTSIRNWDPKNESKFIRKDDSIRLLYEALDKIMSK
ncbi:MAG: hypothetical protein WC503_04185 [Candidatus Shapirobacteria bacterium]